MSVMLIINLGKNVCSLSPYSTSTSSPASYNTSSRDMSLYGNHVLWRHKSRDMKTRVDGFVVDFKGRPITIKQETL